LEVTESKEIAKMLRITDYEWWRDPRWEAPSQSDDDDDGGCKDGEIVRRPLLLMDGMAPIQRKAAEVLRDDAAERRLEDAYAAYQKSVSEAWRLGPPQFPATTEHEQRELAQPKRVAVSHPPQTVEQAYQAYHERVTSAWRQR
jgi:hypothetical protein